MYVGVRTYAYTRACAFSCTLRVYVCYFRRNYLEQDVAHLRGGVDGAIQVCSVQSTVANIVEEEPETTRFTLVHMRAICGPLFLSVGLCLHLEDGGCREREKRRINLRCDPIEYQV